MKEKITQIIGPGVEPERTELKTTEIIVNINSHIISVFKASKDLDSMELLNKLLISI